METKFDKAISVATLLSAMVAVGIALSSRFSTPSPGVLEKPPSVYVRAWEAVADSGMLIGLRSAPVVVAEFTDFQCPFCREFQKSLMAIKRRFGDSVAVSIVHFPLPMHREARSTARIAQCAHEQRRGVEMTDFIFLHQDSIGRQDAAWFAASAAIPDLAQFAECISSARSDSSVERGFQTAKRLGLNRAGF